MAILLFPVKVNLILDARCESSEVLIIISPLFAIGLASPSTAEVMFVVGRIGVSIIQLKVVALGAELPLVSTASTWKV